MMTNSYLTNNQARFLAWMKHVVKSKYCISDMPRVRRAAKEKIK